MTLLDTNVISEMMKPEPDATVRAWLNDQAAETLYLSSVPLAELLFGIQNLAHGKRRNRQDFVLNAILDLLQGRILPFDAPAARHYAELAVLARKAGKGFPTPDGYIAAIAASRHYIVASRDTAPYARLPMCGSSIHSECSEVHLDDHHPRSHHSATIS